MALRLEVSSAFLNQRPVGLPLDIFASHRSFDPAADNVWTHRIVLYLADVLQFCFGEGDPEGKSRGERWMELKRFEDLWEIHKPLCFTPIMNEEFSWEPRPLIWYMSGCQVLGVQFLNLALILLATYDPYTPRLGPRAITTALHTSATVQGIVLRILGNAMANPDMISAQITAHLAIAVCGQCFTKEIDQQGMTRILVELEERYAWPTAKTITELQEVWLQCKAS